MSSHEFDGFREGAPAMPWRVLIADDQALYREGLREILNHWHEFKVVAEVGNGLKAVDYARKHACDLVLMDELMPGMDGIEAARRIVLERPGVAVIILSAGADEDQIVRAFAAGVRGFVLKETSSRQLRAYLQDAACGDIVVSGAIASGIVERLSSLRSGAFAKSAGSSEKVLSDDERAVMKLVAQGLSNEDIGAALYISPGSVKKRLRAIMEKLSLDNRVQVAVYAVRHGMQDDS